LLHGDLAVAQRVALPLKLTRRAWLSLTRRHGAKCNLQSAVARRPYPDVAEIQLNEIASFTL
jgi:hypothetical protein